MKKVKINCTNCGSAMQYRIFKKNECSNCHHIIKFTLKLYLTIFIFCFLIGRVISMLSLMNFYYELLVTVLICVLFVSLMNVFAVKLIPYLIKYKFIK